MAAYRIFDFTIQCDFPLPELPRVGEVDPARIIVTCGGGSATPPVSKWLHRWYSDDDKQVVAIAFGRGNAGYVLSFPQLAEFSISDDFGRIEILEDTSTVGSTVRHLLLDQVVPRIVGQRGLLVLHGAAVRLSNGRGLLLLGSSGSGKSTLASSFHRDGAKIVADDCVMVEVRGGRCAAIPSYAGSRLWEDSAAAVFPGKNDFGVFAEYSNKKRLIPSDHGSDAEVIDLDAVFIIEESDASPPPNDVHLDRIEGAETAMALIKRAFMLDSSDRAAVSSQFTRASQVANKVPRVYVLRYPRDFDRLDAVRAALAAAT